MGATRAFCARRGAVGEAHRRGNPIGMAGAWLPPAAANVRARVLAHGSALGTGDLSLGLAIGS